VSQIKATVPKAAPFNKEFRKVIYIYGDKIRCVEDVVHMGNDLTICCSY